MKIYLAIVILSVGVAYALWVCCSFLLIPFAEPPYSIPTPYWQQEGYYKLRPGRHENPRYQTTFTINAHGFRGAEFDATPKAFRIIAIGESSTMGLESDDSETWPAILEGLLQQRGLKVEVINAGIGGSVSANHVAMLPELLSYHPDLLLYYAGRNDYAISELERYPGPVAFPDGVGRFLRHWFLYKRVQLKWLTGAEVFTNGWARTYEVNLTTMLQGPVPVVLIRQWIQHAEPFSSGWTVSWREHEAFEIQRRFAEQFKVPSIEAIPPANAFYDSVHLTPYGNAALAAAIAEGIAPIVAMRTTS